MAPSIRHFAVTLLLAALGCAGAVPRAVSPPLIAAAVDHHRGPVVVVEPRATRYLTDLGDTLARLADTSSRPWAFRLVDVPDVDAFSAPSRTVYVTRGLVERMEDEAQLATVIGHEIAHVLLGHSAEQLRDRDISEERLAVDCVLARACGDDLGDLERGLAANVRFVQYSRPQKFEADREALAFVRAAGVSPLGMHEVITTLRAERARDRGRVLLWPVTHPVDLDRALQAATAMRWLPRDFIREMSPELSRGTRRDSPGFRAFMREIRARRTIAATSPRAP
ncbi:MAG: M48 family metallopeptidase [Gemmatimonadaceae bacterium]|nr:M48 family metallopeptidase [Gemmatimonadaceae bacterium]